MTSILRRLLMLSAVWAALFVPCLATAQFTDTFNYGPISAPMTHNGWTDPVGVYSVNSSNVLLGPTVAGGGAGGGFLPAVGFLLRPTSEDSLSGTVTVYGPAWAASGNTAASSTMIGAIARYTSASSGTYYAAQLNYEGSAPGLTANILRCTAGTATVLLGHTGFSTSIVTGTAGHVYSIALSFSGGGTNQTLTATVTDVNTSTVVTSGSYTDASGITTTGQNGLECGFNENGNGGATGVGNVTEFTGPGTAAAPATPTASPACQYSNSPVTVTLADSTGGANIYYTTDGTVPTTGSSLYTSPIAVPPGATLKVIANNGSSSSVLTCTYYLGVYTPGTTWYDTTGTAIVSSGASIIYSSTTSLYYWFYVDYSGVSGLNNYNCPIKCLSSPDLLNWTPLGTMVAGGGGSIIYSRPSVIYNATNNNYVMVFHYDNSSFGLHSIIIYTSPNLTNGGTWTVSGTTPFYFQPDGIQSNDEKVFVDTGGTAYLVFAAGGNATLDIATFNSSYTGIVGSSHYVAINQPQEAPSITKVGSTYFLIVSGVTSWTPNLNVYYTATSIAGPWTKAPANSGNICQVSGLQNNLVAYSGQNANVLQIQGTSNYIWISDQYGQTNLNTSTEAWLPMFFSGSTLYTEWLTNWTPSAIFPTTVTAPTRRFIH